MDTRRKTRHALSGCLLAALAACAAPGSQEPQEQDSTAASAEHLAIVFGEPEAPAEQPAMPPAAPAVEVAAEPSGVPKASAQVEPATSGPEADEPVADEPVADAPVADAPLSAKIEPQPVAVVEVPKPVSSAPEAGTVAEAPAADLPARFDVEASRSAPLTRAEVEQLLQSMRADVQDGDNDRAMARFRAADGLVVDDGSELFDDLVLLGRYLEAMRARSHHEHR